MSVLWIAPDALGTCWLNAGIVQISNDKSTIQPIKKFFFDIFFPPKINLSQTALRDAVFRNETNIKTTKPLLSFVFFYIFMPVWLNDSTNALCATRYSSISGARHISILVAIIA